MLNFNSVSQTSSAFLRTARTVGRRWKASSLTPPDPALRRRTMNHHPDNRLFRAINRLAAPDTAPLEKLEAEARMIWPRGAESGSLYVLHAGGDDFIYQWGDVM